MAGDPWFGTSTSRCLGLTGIRTYTSCGLSIPTESDATVHGMHVPDREDGQITFNHYSHRLGILWIPRDVEIGVFKAGNNGNEKP